MNFFFVLNGKTIKQLTLIIIAAFFTAWFLYLESYIHIPTFSDKNEPKAIYKGEKNLALTFNIGWGDEKAEPILDILKREEIATATFFLSGAWAERHPDLVERIVKDGYEIGLLGYNYVDYTNVEEEEVRKDLATALEAFKKLNIKNIKLARAPTGHFDQKTLKIAERLGLTFVHWSVDSKDWTNPGVEVIVKNVSKAKKGDIILMHASDSAKQTADAIPSIMKELRKKGLKFVNVSEMIVNADSKTKEIK
ncbi:putative polysaccharide deacetylase PdaB [Robertmurraya siralis]|uniref:Polysaccharide deacetylase PdaB n=1 Tax=Robertmurraya siralis TaxID=77777 RepID=A0A919WM35_9BACI|nr:polysaccharide deacetylase family sporulation protein PdaB [Robertmurraya siralis]PAE18974.1 polysaccharide deacetylase family sporulation protein PdaB [Bacillus sp. 7504-2]GIN64238.1 putative polysaccharide deacetylase PdaB [Robertmurraya siralis]